MQLFTLEAQGLEGNSALSPLAQMIQNMIHIPAAEYILIPTLQVILANTGDPQASHLASKLSETGAKVVGAKHRNSI